MGLYTFYPTRHDGVSALFTDAECVDDGHALLEAVRLLEEHRSAERVVIWCGPRRVLTCLRVDEPNPRLA